MTRDYETEVERCKQKTVEAYDHDSMIEGVTSMQFVEADARIEGIKFTHIYVRHLVPKEWLTDPAIVPDLFFADLGRSVAIGETAHLIQQVKEKAETEIGSLEWSLGNLEKVVTDFIGSGNSNPVVFIPIEKYVDLWTWDRNRRPIVEGVGKYEWARFENARVPILWSTKYYEFSNLMIVDKSFGTWMVKIGNRTKTLSIDFTPSEQDEERVDVLVRTIVNYRIDNPSAIAIFSLTQ